MIKAVFFDLDGTLRLNLPAGGEVFAAYAGQLGLRVRDDDRLRAMRWEHFYWANSWELTDDRQQFDGNEAAFWDHYARRRLMAMGASAAQAIELAPKINEHMSNSYKPESVVPEDARRALPVLVEQGYRLAVISNRSQPYPEVVEALGLSPFFAFSLAGGEIKAFKPEPEIFLHACKRIGVSAAEAAYVGDNYYADVIGARRAGLMPVLYDPQGIFPDPDCASVASFDELPTLLNLKQGIPTASDTKAAKREPGLQT